MDGDELLTITKAADELGVSHMTIRRYIQDGRIKTIKPGRDYLIERRELRKLERPKLGRRPAHPSAP